MATLSYEAVMSKSVHDLHVGT